MEGAESDADEDEDYMSEAFLKGLEDVRPGLLTKTQKRKKKSDERHEMSKALPKRKVIKIAESEARQHALSTPISSSSKGYSLLQKMGYKEGTGLGKSGDTWVYGDIYINCHIMFLQVKDRHPLFLLSSRKVLLLHTQRFLPCHTALL